MAAAGVHKVVDSLKDGAGAVKVFAARVAKRGAPAVEVTFGRNPNQVFHAFRHVDKMGLARDDVMAAVLKDLEEAHEMIPSGKPLNRVVEVGGKKLQYSAFRLSDGSVNVGRIHGVP